MKYSLGLLFTLLLHLTLLSQENTRVIQPKVKFSIGRSSHHLIDTLFDSKNKIKSIEIGIHENTSIPIKINLTNGGKNFEKNEIKIFQNDSIRLTSNLYKKNDSTYFFYTPISTTNYSLTVQYKQKTKQIFNLHYLKENQQKIILIPLQKTILSSSDLCKKLNEHFKVANIQFDAKFYHHLKLKEFDTNHLFSNPSPNFDIYTHEMRELRDYFFERKSNQKNAFYLFLIPGFQDSSIHYYMPKGKGIGFISLQHKDISTSISKALLVGMAAYMNQSTNTYQSDSIDFSPIKTLDWESIHENSFSRLYYDAEENIQTNNGMIAYYFWKEDHLGNILWDGKNILSALKRPYKKNFISYHLNIRDVFLKPLYKIGKFLICLYHISFIVVSLLVTFLIRYIIKRKIKKHFKRTFFLNRIGFSFAYVIGVAIVYFGFVFTAIELKKQVVYSGLIKDLKNLPYQKAKYAVLELKDLKQHDEQILGSEVLHKRNKKWYMKRRKSVLYFTLQEDESGKPRTLRYSHDDTKLTVNNFNFNEKTFSHYFVINYENSSGTIYKQEVFNHKGNNITSKLINREDSPKRILVFVNGYRPSSLGRNFEDAFDDIRKNGLEYENSKNHIFNFDRYDYWHRWNQYDDLFKERINPTETFYADGHFSVTTSNYKSLIAFTNAATNYPHRCKNPKKHICKKLKDDGSIWSWFHSDKTTDLLILKSNKAGFNERKRNGKIAGKNLLQELNEIPNKSPNDTLIIVCHSMGFAYTCGMIEELRGKINFGELYVIAPENALGGRIKLKEWNKVYQYSNNLHSYFYSKPCLLDGIAPQFRIPGIPKDHQLFTPDQNYEQMGFFDSHFIGYYRWIFDIPSNQNGSVLKR